ncbi:MAG: LysE family translocator [Sulfitobacter sp.]
MSYEIIPALALFAFVSSVTPGPNNLMLMASGANFGFWRSIPHMMGISIGFVVLMIGVGAGLVQVFDAYPQGYTVMKWLSVGYMLYLAWRIANAGRARAKQAGAKPLSFLAAAAFQWVNPKAWAMALTAVTVYVPGSNFWPLALAAVIFGTVNLPSVTLWTVLGQQMSRLLGDARRLRAFNITMAVLLIASLYPVLQMG